MRHANPAETWDDVFSSGRGCPICGFVPSAQPKRIGEVARYDCRVCGQYDLERECFEDYLSMPASDAWTISPKQAITVRLALSYWLHKSRIQGAIPLLTSGITEGILKEPYTPDPKTLMDNIVTHLGEGIRWEHQKIKGYDFARLGARHFNELEAALEELQVAGLVRISPSKMLDTLEARLTLAGWDRWSAIKAGRGYGNVAFLAMKFGTDLDRTFKPAAQEACQQAGFFLNQLDDKPEPGLIDVLMEKAIVDARFVIADLTYDNSGAYWEAGFAHGLRKPVIYTCRKGAPVHFDVRNWQRVEWSEDDLPNAQRQIVAMIELMVPGARRATPAFQA